jgi:threonine dehydrogenase-like Zn-dependent dehydrogenase
VIEPNYPCGRCPVCQAGRTSTCPNRVIVGINAPGLLRERVAVPAPFAWPAPDGVSDEDLVCTEPLAVARSAVRTSSASSGDRCLVIGAGSQGLLLCQLLLALGAEVAVIEPHRGRRQLAREIGATTPESVSVPHPLVFETSGSRDGIHSSVELVEPGGTVVMIGIPHTDIPISIASVVRQQVRVIGSLIYDHPTDFRETLALLADHTVRPSAILSPPSDFVAVSDALAGAANVAGKSWISFNGATISPIAEAARLTDPHPSDPETSSRVPASQRPAWIRVALVRVLTSRRMALLHPSRWTGGGAR